MFVLTWNDKTDPIVISDRQAKRYLTNRRIQIELLSIWMIPGTVTCVDHFYDMEDR